MSTDVEVAIVGGGFSGVGLAIALAREGIEDVVVLERNAGIGGTWWANTYPGCGCDVPSHLYSYSFAPNPGWSRTYSRQPEIRAYLTRVADELGVTPKVRLSTEVESARWDEASARWHLRTTAGEELSARVLVSAAGPLVTPRIPRIPGLERFAGPAFHSARWDHDVDLTGKRVAVIGTGASAIQFVPQIAPEVAQLHVFQRTPPWVVAHGARPTRAFERRLYRLLPSAQRLVRGAIYGSREALVLGFAKRPSLMRIVERGARAQITRQVHDPELRRRVTPDYTIGCKRILPSNDWYPTLARENVELVDGAAVEVREHSIVGADGREREVDAIVYATGFEVGDLPLARRLHGRDGHTLAYAWRRGPAAFLGSTVAGFPNMFLMLGPNTGLGHSSMIYMIESQIAYITGALRELRARGARSVEVDPSAVAAYNTALQRRMRGTVWSTGCSSWYLDAAGRNPTLWPDWTWRFRRAARFDAAQHVITA